MTLGARSPTSPRRVRGLLLEQEVLRHRISGKSFGKIAELCGVSKSTVGGALKRALARTRKLVDESAEVLREIELQSLCEMQNACYEKALGGDLAAIEVVLKISARRSQLAGLNAPTLSQSHVTHASGQPFLTRDQQDAAIRERLAALMVASDDGGARRINRPALPQSASPSDAIESSFEEVNGRNLIDAPAAREQLRCGGCTAARASDETNEPKTEIAPAEIKVRATLRIP